MNTKPAASISSIMAIARSSNNGRINSLALNASEIRCAEKAVDRGILKMWHAELQSYGYVKFFSIA